MNIKILKGNIEIKDVKLNDKIFLVFIFIFLKKGLWHTFRDS